MPDSLTALQAQRHDLVAQFGKLGDFRRGSITGTGGRCGTSSCHCHRPGDPGHDPHPRLTYKVQGKTVTESLGGSAAERKAEQEIAEFRRYQEVSRAFLEVNEKICRLRPVEDTLTPQEKKRSKRSSKRLRKK
jgi:hypothetical protein